MKVGEDALQAACTLQRGRGIVPARQSAEQRHVPLQVQRHRAHAHLGRANVLDYYLPACLLTWRRWA